MAGKAEQKHIGMEEHFKARELAEKWKVSPDTINRWFQDEPGVLKLCTAKRKRVELRIPLSVALRVHEQRAR